MADRLCQGLTELKARLERVLEARQAADNRAAERLQSEEAAFKKAQTERGVRLAADQQRLKEEDEATTRQVENRYQRRAANFEAAGARVRAQLDAQATAAIGVLEQQQHAADTAAKESFEQEAAAPREFLEQMQARAEQLRAAAAELQEKIAAFARERRVRVDESLPVCPLQDFTDAPDRTASELERRLQAAAAELESARLKPTYRRAWVFLCLVALLPLAAAGPGLYLWLTPPVVWYALAGDALALYLMLALTWSLRSSGRERVGRNLAELHRTTRLVFDTLAQQETAVEGWFNARLAELETRRASRTLAADETLLPKMAECRAAAEGRVNALTTRRKALTRKLAQRRQGALERVRSRFAERAAHMQAQCETDLAAASAAHAAQQKRLEAEHRRELEELAAAWRETLAAIQAFGRQECDRLRATFASWGGRSAEQWVLPESFPQEVYLGEVAVALAGLLPQAGTEGPFSVPPSFVVTLPLVLAFPLHGSLTVQAAAEKRPEAVQLLFSAVLRLEAALPPGKLKLSVLDPVGLGQNFAALMHLADYDEALVGGRIWTEGSHIERRLGELTEHMEKVIQKYLRNRYACIDDYNREAGALAEPYRVLVIADFPVGFSELAVERLAAIVSSGVRCGVYTLIHHDARQALPRLLEQANLRRNGYLVLSEGDAFVVDEVGLNRGGFQFEPLPAPAVVNALLEAVGTRAREATRVQVPFQVAAPEGSQVWSRSSELSIRLPLGRVGADRLQYLELGRGTAQHALIAGKTGSGKSNLFHVLITNTALWYSPGEVELYLIDFKKGVEFKIYGTHHLPHARVVAIESDREFGLSVLRRLDQELVTRGELFRAAQVQDVASYRRVAGRHLPRIMLIIDEFQEFFTEDDGVAQEAALLLDRMVRQGRAFGLHVVLGSQTLGGAYTLAKSTLGQMAVRIALQCNEADSYLILSDDNAAARLLSRPGDAIYNDMSGLVEGNNPFQIVLLEKEVQDEYLGLVQRKVAAEALTPGALTVFEGSRFADVRENPLLLKLARGAGEAPAALPRVWLGEPNAIKGPTEASFAPQAGSNLLIIGQHRAAGVAMSCAAVLSLAASSHPERLRIHVLDGTEPGSGTQERLAALAAALPHPIRVTPYRDVPQLMEELAAELKARQGGAPTDQRRFLLALGFERFRMLRQDDDFGFADSSKAASPAQCLANLLGDGPIHGLHTIAWCDTMSNLNRAFSRKTQRDFEMRVLFQMSASDSAELIDSPAANRLGLYSALLYTAQQGAVEKFRPYEQPDPEFVVELGRALRERYRGLPAARA